MEIIQTLFTCLFTDKFDAVNHTIQTCIIFQLYSYTCMFCTEINNSAMKLSNVHPEQSLNFQILFQIQTSFRLRCVAESEASD